MNLKPILVSTTLVVATACGLFGPQTTTDDENTIKPTTSEDGTETYQVKAGEEVSIEVADDALKGGSLQIPAGALDVGVDISIEEGTSLASDDQLAAFGGNDNEVSSAGPAMVIEPSESVDASEPMKIAIPLATIGLNLAEQNLVVAFKVVKKSEDGSLFAGVIPTSKLTQKDGKVEFESKYFGVFQALYFTAEITDTVEALSAAPIIAKKTTSLLAGSWEQDCSIEHDNDGNPDGSQIFTLSASDTKFSMVIYQNSDTHCETPMAKMGIIGDYKIGEKVDTPEADTYEFEFTSTVNLVTILADFLLEEANHHSLCGISDWALETPKKVDLHKCDFDALGGDNANLFLADGTDDSSSECQDGTPKLNEKTYSILKFTDGKAFFGQPCGDHDGSSKENRHNLFQEEGFTKL